MMDNKSISIQSASKLTGFAESTLQQACVHGEIKSHKDDLVHWNVDVDSLDEWTKKHHAQKNPRAKKTASEKLGDVISKEAKEGGFIATVKLNDEGRKRLIENHDLPDADHKVTLCSDDISVASIANDINKKIQEDIDRNEMKLKNFENNTPMTSVMLFPKHETRKNHNFQDEVVTLTYADLQAYGDKRYKDGFKDGTAFRKEVDSNDEE